MTGLFLGIFSPGSRLVVFSILGLDGRFGPVTAWVSAVLFALGLAAAVSVFWPGQRGEAQVRLSGEEVSCS